MMLRSLAAIRCVTLAAMRCCCHAVKLHARRYTHSLNACMPTHPRARPPHTHMYAEFDAMDANGDGVVTLEEFRDALSASGGGRGSGGGSGAALAAAVAAVVGAEGGGERE